MPTTAEGQELPYAGTPEMDALIQQINKNPEMLAVVGQQPALLAEVMKHVGLNTSEQQLIDMVSEWPDEAAEAAMGSDGTASARAVPVASRPELPPEYTQPDDEDEEEPEEPEIPDAA